MGKTHRKDADIGKKSRGEKIPPRSKYAEKQALKAKEELKAPLPIVPPPRHAYTPPATEQERPRRDTTTQTLKTVEFQGCGKIIYLDAVKNDRGKALRIVEVSKGARTMVLIPAELVRMFEESLAKVTPELF